MIRFQSALAIVMGGLAIATACGVLVPGRLLYALLFVALAGVCYIGVMTSMALGGLGVWVDDMTRAVKSLAERLRAAVPGDGG